MIVASPPVAVSTSTARCRLPTSSSTSSTLPPWSPPCTPAPLPLPLRCVLCSLRLPPDRSVTLQWGAAHTRVAPRRYVCYSEERQQPPERITRQDHDASHRPLPHRAAARPRPRPRYPRHDAPGHAARPLE